LFADIASFFVQSAGGGFTASHDIAVAKTGSKILLGGLCLILAVFIFFICMLAYLHINLLKRGTKFDNNVKVIIYVLYADMILLIIRSSYRVAEYGNLQYHNSISTNEHLFFGLDTVEMALVNLLWIPFHPGFWKMLENDKELPRDEVPLQDMDTKEEKSLNV